LENKHGDYLPESEILKIEVENLYKALSSIPGTEKNNNRK
jgi:hypothetical protein